MSTGLWKEIVTGSRIERVELTAAEVAALVPPGAAPPAHEDATAKVDRLIDAITSSADLAEVKTRLDAGDAKAR